MKHPVNEIHPTNSENVFISPLTQKSAAWSSKLEARTPELFDTHCEHNKTPALRARLGIQPDLDVSWCSEMATPQNSEKLPCPFPPNITPDVEETEGKGKRLQYESLNRVSLIPPDEQQPKKEERSPLLFEKYQSTAEENKSKSIGPGNTDFLSIFTKRKSSFVYPDPIKIQLTPKIPGLSKLQITNKHEPEHHIIDNISSPVVLSQRKRKQPKEIRKSLKFNDRTNESSFESSSTTDNSFSLDHEDNGKVNVNQLQEELVGKESTCDDQNIQKFTDRIGELSNKQEQIVRIFETACDLDLAISNKVLARAKVAVDEEDKSFFSTFADYQNDLEAAPFSTVVRQFENIPGLNEPIANRSFSGNGGFSTASGKKLWISDKALAKAASLFELGDEEEANCQSDIEESKNLKNTSLSHKFNEASDHKWIEDVKKTQPILSGFNTASGKGVSVSYNAIQRAQKIFDTAEDTSSPNSDFLNGELTDLCSKGHDLQFTSKKNFHLTDKALLHSEKPPTGTTPSCKTVVPMHNSSLPHVYPFQAVQSENDSTGSHFPSKSVGFNTASGKNIMVSANALKQAKNLLDDANLEILQGKPKEKILVPDFQCESTRPYKVASEICDNHLKSTDAPGFSTAGGKNLIVSEEALLRAQQLFDENNGTTFRSLKINAVINTEAHIDELSYQEKVSEDSSLRKRKKEEEKTPDEDEDTWISSPTIGKKKKKKPSQTVSSSQVCGTPLSDFVNVPTCVPAKILVQRREARQQESSLIQLKRKKNLKLSPKPGRYFNIRNQSQISRLTFRKLISQTSSRKSYKPYELLNDFGILPSVCLVTAANAKSFNFHAWEHFPVEECKKNTHGFQLGDFCVILSDDNTVGCDEIGSSLLISEGVDSSLISMEWIRNHYRWIVWKLASMELKMPNLFGGQCLTPLNVLEQLKYRYDIEIDHCRRSALKRIIEQDDTPAKTMVLCVAHIQSDTIIELTDGWYSIEAHCDHTLSQLIEKGKIFVGVKLVISGAELVAPGPTTPLEKGSDTYLKISANSTRRAKWDLKLGFYKHPHPFPVTLRSILPDGGLVSRTEVIVVRIYPMVYMEKTTDGKTVFHSERHFQRLSDSEATRYERTMEQLIESIEREEDEQEKKRPRSDQSQVGNISYEERRNRILAEARRRMEKNALNRKRMEGVPLLKLRVIDKTFQDSTSAIVSVWRPNEDLLHHIKERWRYHLFNVNAAGLRFGELQLNSIKHTIWKEISNEECSISETLTRSVTPFHVASQPSFKPSFNELDVVGLVVFVGDQQAKGPFQTIVLSDGLNFFGVKCWSTLDEYSLSDLVKTGTFLSFANLQWRTTASRSISRMPFAFIYEGTLVSSRPAHKHLACALEELKRNIADVSACVSEAENQISQLLGSNTPHSVTQKLGSDLRRNIHTPSGSSSIDRKETPTSANPTVSRARLLEKYGNPPSLTQLNGISSPHVRQKFKPPARKSIA